MKKILLAAASAALITASSAYAAEDTFYVKANAGWVKLDKTKNNFNKNGNSVTVNGKSKNDAFVGAAVGYYVMNNARVELAFDHYLNPRYKGSINNVDGKLKTTADTLLVNAFVDLYEMDQLKLFAGAGVGVSQVSGKFSVSNGDSYKLKRKNNATFAGYVGASYEFTQGVTGELVYSYRDLGKTKSYDHDKVTVSSARIKGHLVSAGVRFDI